jgi:hypothetical protein
MQEKSIEDLLFFGDNFSLVFYKRKPRGEEYAPGLFTLTSIPLITHGNIAVM